MADKPSASSTKPPPFSDTLRVNLRWILGVAKVRTLQV